MKKDQLHHETSSVERRVREADVIGRAKAASPLGGSAGTDRLGNRGDVSALNSGRDRL